MAQQNHKDASVSPAADLLGGILLTVQSVLTLSSETGQASLVVAVKEKKKANGTSLYHCKIMSTVEEPDNGIEEILAANEKTGLIHSLFRIQETVDESCFRWERTITSENRTLLQKLYLPSCRNWKISEKSRDETRIDEIKTVALICSVQNENNMLHLTAKLHEFLYKICAFGVMKKLTFSATVGQLKYSTDFVSREDFADARDCIVIAKSEHYFQDVETQKIKFTAGDWHPLACHGEILARKVSFRFLVSPFDAPGKETRDASIHLYCAGWHGPLFCKCTGNTHQLLSVLPLSKLGLTLNNVNDRPASNGLLIPDFILKASKPKIFPTHCVIILMLAIERDYLQKAKFFEKIQIFNALTTNFDNIIVLNTDQIQRAFLEVTEVCLENYRRHDASLRSSTNMQQAISLTVSSVREIVSASTSSLFRDTCFNIFGVCNSDGLEECLLARMRDIAAQKPSSSTRKRRKDDRDECGPSRTCAAVQQENSYTRLPEINVAQSLDG